MVQLAINILVFVLGFSIATLVAFRPKKSRQDLEKFTSNLRQVTDGLKNGYLKNPDINAEALNSYEKTIMTGTDNLLTK